MTYILWYHRTSQYYNLTSDSTPLVKTPGELVKWTVRELTVIYSDPGRARKNLTTHKSNCETHK